MATVRRRVGGPAWSPGDPTLSISQIAERLAPIAPDTAGTIQRIRHWTREQMLLPAHQHHAGTGKHRRYSEDAIYDAAILHIFTSAGISVSGSRTLVDALTMARFAIPKWKAERSKGRTPQCSLVALRTVKGMGTFGVLWEGEKFADVRGFKMTDVVMKIEIDLTKLFMQIESK